MAKLRETLNRVGLNTFFFLLIGMIFLASTFPDWGAEAILDPLKTITGIGISFIFFFYGVKLSPEKLKQGLSNWKLHVLVQSTTFLIFPLVLSLAHVLILPTVAVLLKSSAETVALKDVFRMKPVMINTLTFLADNTFFNPLGLEIFYA